MNTEEFVEEIVGDASEEEVAHNVDVPWNEYDSPHQYVADIVTGCPSRVLVKIPVWYAKAEGYASTFLSADSVQRETEQAMQFVRVCDLDDIADRHTPDYYDELIWMPKSQVKVYSADKNGDIEVLEQ